MANTLPANFSTPTKDEYVFFKALLCKIIGINYMNDEMIIEQVLKDEDGDCIYTVPNTEGDGRDLPRTCGYGERVYEAAKFCYHSVSSFRWRHRDGSGSGTGWNFKFPLDVNSIIQTANLFGVDPEDILDLDSTSEQDVWEEDIPI